MEVYRFHTEDYTLDNKDVADAMGDATFICFEEGITGNSLVSLYQIEVNTTWGQYALCNFNVCVAQQHNLVGQEAADGLFPNGGQCQANENVGNWYSLDDVGKCAEGMPVGTDGCTWRVLAINKTITSTCLNQIGFYNACLADGGVPYTGATAVFEGAFLSDNPSQGGCPAITPPSSSSSSSRSQKNLTIRKEKMSVLVDEMDVRGRDHKRLLDASSARALAIYSLTSNPIRS